MPGQFYTYLYLRHDGTPYYVGKGSGKRAFVKCNRSVVVPDVSRIVVQEHETESEAFVAEIFLILYYGRKDRGGILHNRTDGGDGISPAWNRGKALSVEHRAHLRKPHRTFKKSPMSLAHREAIRRTLKANLTPEEHALLKQRARLGAAARWGKG